MLFHWLLMAASTRDQDPSWKRYWPPPLLETLSLEESQPGCEALEDGDGVLRFCGSTKTLNLDPSLSVDDAPPMPSSTAADSPQDGTALPGQAGSRSSPRRGVSAGKCTIRRCRSSSSRRSHSRRRTSPQGRGRKKKRGRRTSGKRRSQKRSSQNSGPSTEQGGEASAKQGNGQGSEETDTPPQNKRRKSSSEGKKKRKRLSGVAYDLSRPP
ncbi:unnamed protein product [Coregonus sp. 'balchen']|nr:unnamed protein product [Coregonus sp. 'balchen']